MVRSIDASDWAICWGCFTISGVEESSRFYSLNLEYNPDETSATTGSRPSQNHRLPEPSWLRDNDDIEDGPRPHHRQFVDGTETNGLEDDISDQRLRMTIQSGNNLEVEVVLDSSRS